MINLAFKIGTGVIIDPTPRGALIGATHKLQNRDENLVKKTDFLALAVLAGMKYALSQTYLSSYSSLGALSLFAIASFGAEYKLTNTFETSLSIVSMGCVSLLYKNSSVTQLAMIAFLRFATFYHLDLKKRGEISKANLMEKIILPAMIPLFHLTTLKSSSLPLFGALYEISSASGAPLSLTVSGMWSAIEVAAFSKFPNTFADINPLRPYLPWLVITITAVARTQFDQLKRTYLDWRTRDPIPQRRSQPPVGVDPAREVPSNPRGLFSFDGEPSWEDTLRLSAEGMELLHQLEGMFRTSPDEGENELVRRRQNHSSASDDSRRIVEPFQGRPSNNREQSLEEILRGSVELLRLLQSNTSQDDDENEQLQKDQLNRGPMRAEATESALLHEILQQDSHLAPYTCAITQGIALDPCFASTNPSQIYHYQALKQWVEKEGTDPSNRMKLSEQQIIRLPKSKAFILDRIRHIREDPNEMLLKEAQDELKRLRDSLTTEKNEE